MKEGWNHGYSNAQTVTYWSLVTISFVYLVSLVLIYANMSRYFLALNFRLAWIFSTCLQTFLALHLTWWHIFLPLLQFTSLHIFLPLRQLKDLHIFLPLLHFTCWNISLPLLQFTSLYIFLPLLNSRAASTVTSVLEIPRPSQTVTPWLWVLLHLFLCAMWSFYGHCHKPVSENVLAHWIGNLTFLLPDMHPLSWVVWLKGSPMKKKKLSRAASSGKDISQILTATPSETIISRMELKSPSSSLSWILGNFLSFLTWRSS